MDALHKSTKMFTASTMKREKKFSMSMKDLMIDLEAKRYITQPFTVDRSVAHVLHSFVPQIHQRKWRKFHAKMTIGEIPDTQVKEEHKNTQSVLVSIHKIPDNENLQVKATSDNDHGPMQIGRSTAELEALDNISNVLVAHANSTIQMKISDDVKYGPAVCGNNTVQLEPLDISSHETTIILNKTDGNSFVVEKCPEERTQNINSSSYDSENQQTKTQNNMKSDLPIKSCLKTNLNNKTRKMVRFAPSNLVAGEDLVDDAKPAQKLSRTEKRTAHEGVNIYKIKGTEVHPASSTNTSIRGAASKLRIQRTRCKQLVNYYIREQL